VTLFDQTIEARFERFVADHPEVYTLFVQFAREWRSAGHSRGSASAICERIRWETGVNPEHDEGFKMTDHFTSRLARKLMADDATFEGFFETRRLRAA